MGLVEEVKSKSNISPKKLSGNFMRKISKVYVKLKGAADAYFCFRKGRQEVEETQNIKDIPLFYALNSLFERRKPLSTTEHPIVVGIFKDEEKAKRALDILREVGFSDEQVSVAVPGRELKADSILDNLVDVDLPEEEISYYVRQFEVGRSIVWVKHRGRQLEVASILMVCGTRIHEYFKICKADVWVSRNESQEIQFEALQGSSFSNSSNNPSPLKVEKTAPQEIPAWMRILKDAGFEHLI